MNVDTSSSYKFKIVTKINIYNWERIQVYEKQVKVGRK